MTEPREIEAKFDFEKRDRDSLLALTYVGRFAVRERQSVDQDDIYYDTDDGLLGAAGATLRVRRTAKGARMTFKGRREAGASDDAHIASRLEDEVTLDPAHAAAIPFDAALPELDGLSPLERARQIAGARELRPIARLQNRRTTLVLSDDDGATLELAVDDCVGTRISDGRQIAFDEIEIETKSAGRDTLIAAAGALRELVPSLRPSPQTKLGRTLD